ncbi:Sec-independent protein translocase protein TatB [Paenalcaligenes niemegkensis]|uniref:Sec-independent protein translocase protein TatB n=1 Tax=Paenalcaligenes niemegkensis TaxID=2895469 RepID=UPI001EE7F3AF|nr:Sec-independent protein translocase protein TatB [Paenalcaligenes niemegkensis]MCQ9618119.1 Sec-independent protein translocase protein TatB [Paenalcaligenes niemegkensis]
MFDISFSELLLIGIVALIVLGPERLPKVARTVGHLFGRAQRYVSEVKTDIEREINLEEVKSIKNQVKDAAESVRESVNTTTKQISDPLEEARRAVGDFASTTEKSVNSLVEDARSSNAPSESAEDATKDHTAQAELPLDSTETPSLADDSGQTASTPASVPPAPSPATADPASSRDEASELKTENAGSDTSNATSKGNL